MPNFIKDKNFIVITLDNGNSYRLNIDNCVLYGVRGTPIKSCPQKTKIREMFPRFSNDGTNLTYVLNEMFYHPMHEWTEQYAKALQGADKLDAIGFHALRCSYERYAYLNDNFKYVALWLKTNDRADFDPYYFERWCEFEKIRSSLGSVANQLTAEMYGEIQRWSLNLTAEELAICVYYFTTGRAWEYHGGSMHHVRDYIIMCRKIEYAPRKTNNFMREYCEVKKTYELHRAEFDDRQLKRNYANKEKAWEFEYGNYKVVLPTCAMDIVDEGKNMHHCVGSYVSRVVDGDCFIVFIRNKETPNDCYITCQVYTDGRIGQYYLAYDHCIHKQEDIDFRNAFQEHLNNVWNS